MSADNWAVCPRCLSGHCQTCHLNIDFKDEHPFYEREKRASVTVDDLLVMPPDAVDALSEEVERGGAS